MEELKGGGCVIRQLIKNYRKDDRDICAFVI